MKRLFLIVATCAAVLAGCERAEDGATPIALSDAELRINPVPGRPAALYFTLKNNQSVPDRLTAVTVEGAARAELHTTEIDGDVARMERVDAIEIPAGKAVAFARGGSHVMVFGLESAEDAPVAVTLDFARADAVTLSVAPRPLGARSNH